MGNNDNIARWLTVVNPYQKTFIAKVCKVIADPSCWEDNHTYHSGTGIGYLCNIASQNTLLFIMSG